MIASLEVPGLVGSAITPAAAWLARREPPLDPDGEEARRELRRELAHPEYYDANILDRVMNWLGRLVDDTIGAASGAPSVSVAIAILVALLLLVAIMLIVSRARSSARAGAPAAPALTEESITADELRARAERALAAGDSSGALVDAFRALAVRQIERDRIDDLPQATAHELAAALEAVFVDQRSSIRLAADRFDLTLYGDRPASRDQVVEMFGLDDSLARQRVRR